MEQNRNIETRYTNFVVKYIKKIILLAFNVIEKSVQMDLGVKIKEELVFEDEKFYSEGFLTQNHHSIDIKEELQDNYDDNEIISFYPMQESFENNMVEASSRNQLHLKCEICKKKMKRKSLYSHMKQIHAIVNEIFRCRLCCKTFKSSIHLKHHENTHNKQFKCSFCGKNFSQKFELSNHISRQHENPGSFECKVCLKKFNLKKILKSHEKTHDKDRKKSYKCDLCDYATDNSHHLQRHQETHRHKRIISFISTHVKTEK